MATFILLATWPSLPNKQVADLRTRRRLLSFWVLHTYYKVLRSVGHIPPPIPPPPPPVLIRAVGIDKTYQLPINNFISLVSLMKMVVITNLKQNCVLYVLAVFRLFHLYHSS